jgi:hypothetical protein
MYIVSARMLCRTRIFGEFTGCDNAKEGGSVAPKGTALPPIGKNASLELLLVVLMFDVPDLFFDLVDLFVEHMLDVLDMMMSSFAQVFDLFGVHVNFVRQVMAHFVEVLSDLLALLVRLRVG